jgi:cysteine synthase
VDDRLYDELVPVAGPDGIAWAQKLARSEGILTGVSGGSTFAVAMKIAERADAGTVILCMLPDTGERYMSTPLFEAIPEEMTEEEVALSRSTPGYRLV